MISKPVRVLFVDDNQLMAGSLERRLAFEKQVMYVGWVADPTDAARVAQEADADIVMLDVDMPGDSFELARELSTMLPNVKVVMFSGYTKADYVDRAVDVGAWGYISKSETMETIISAIRRVASGEFVLSPEAESMQAGEPE
jgi:DNA-binding NarL/FixJ family response regulator